MAELFLVRHGQASFGSDNYDQLSELGYQQARWLGEYFRERELVFDSIFIGEMHRHLQTAEAICEGLGVKVAFSRHGGFSEFDLSALIQVYLDKIGENMEQYLGKEEYFRLAATVMKAWSEDQLPRELLPESWLEFNQRVAAGMQAVRAAGHQRVLVATSGGTIAMAVRQVMGFNIETQITMNLQSINTAVTHFIYDQTSIYIKSFNNVPHLDIPARLGSITQV